MVFQGLEECAMVSKLERERSALAAAEKELEERRQKLAELEREEAERELNRLIKKVGQDTAIALLELAVKVKPKVAISALEKLGGKV
jgi:protein subunit release factor B